MKNCVRVYASLKEFDLLKDFIRVYGGEIQYSTCIHHTYIRILCVRIYTYMCNNGNILTLIIMCMCVCVYLYVNETRKNTEFSEDIRTNGSEIVSRQPSSSSPPKFARARRNARRVQWNR